MKKWLYIIFGVFLLALGINGFLAPFNMVIGGASGIGIILKRLINLPLWISNLAINLPLLAYATKNRGIKYTSSIIISTLLLSFFLAITSNIVFQRDDIVLAVVFGGFLTGAGLGFVIKSGCSTGGSDLLAMLLYHNFPHLSISKIILAIDSLIIFCGMFVLGVRSTLYAIVTLYISTKVIDLIVEEIDFGKAVFIICQNPQPISNAITQDLKRGATVIATRGGYTNNQNYIVLVVVAKRQITQLKETISTVDNSAFAIVTDVREILGEWANKR